MKPTYLSLAIACTLCSSLFAADPPTVASVSTAAPGVLDICITAGRIIPSRLEDYHAQPGDKINGTKLVRNGQEIAWVIGPKKDQIVTFEQFEGDKLADEPAGNLQNYRISSTDDPSYSAPTAPQAVHRKSKPTDWLQPGDEFVMHHDIYLVLPRPLTEGKTYTIDLGKLNTASPKHTFTYTPRTLRSESVHAPQIGFRPDDPLKRGYLSIWLGTGGAYSFPPDLKFEVLNDATNQSVYSGNVELAKAAGDIEYMFKDQNWNMTDVSRMDFSSLNKPGRYRIYVEGVGCSYPFDIAPDVWNKALWVQMKGFFNQRSGIELGPPHTEYRRPRDHHPADGVKIELLKLSMMANQAEFAKPADSTGQSVTNAWGGWHDAGDWNPRRVTHMEAVLAMLELMDLFPQTYSQLQLNIPQDYKIPDMLNECMWEIDCFRRMQREDGGIGHGIETPGDPLEGEVSWNQSYTAYVFQPDRGSSWYYASVVARAARIMQRYDAKLAGELKTSAIKGMDYAEKEFAASNNSFGNDGWRRSDARNLAALELYRLTADRKYHDIFLQNTVLKDENPNLFQWGKAIQRDAAFAYATMDEKLADPALRKHAVAGLEDQARKALKYASGNAFGVTTADKGKPIIVGFYTAPDSIELCRMHYLTGKSEYLAGAIQSVLFETGCNGDNRTFTTGLGANPIRNPLKVDARHTGQSSPIGQTTFGPNDFQNWRDNFQTWPIKWFLSKVCTPSLYEWPIPEAYCDIYLFVAQNEYTVDRWSSNVYLWGYLNARK